MSINSKQKGKRGELYVVNKFKDNGFKCNRTAQFKGNTGREMTKKTIISTLFLTILVFILTGCTYGELKGQVINKKNTPTKTIMQPIYTGKTMMIFPRTYPEKWEIQIQKEENRRNKNNLGKCFTRRI